MNIFSGNRGTQSKRSSGRDQFSKSSLAKKVLKISSINVSKFDPIRPTNRYTVKDLDLFFTELRSKL